MKHTYKRLRIAIALFAFCSGLYFFTYSGTSISEDELILFDGVHSFAQHGNFWLNYTNSARPPGTYPNNAPLPSVDSEPMQIYASLPLFGLAAAIPGWGLMQTVWLLNILVTALTVVIFFYYAVALGYSDPVAIGGALLLAGATMLWPYSKTYFREPLSTLLILLTACCLEQARRQWAAHGWRWLLGAGAALIAALATKTTAVFIFPALIVIAAPGWLTPSRLLNRLPVRSTAQRRRTIVTAFVIALVIAGVLAVLAIAFNSRYNFAGILNRFSLQRDQAVYALISYLASPGRSIWAFSPILLLGLFGVVTLWRSRSWRLISAPLLAVAGFVLGYAAFQNTDWYGGLAWGPRYLLVITPFLALWLLPILARFPRLPRISQAGVSLLIAISIGVQILGVLPIRAYYDYLGAENVRLGLRMNTINGWQAGTWQLQYIPMVVLTKLAAAGKTGLDYAWQQVSGASPIGILCVLLCLLALIALIRLNRADLPPIRRPAIRVGLWIAALAALFAIGLTVYEADPRYADDPSVRDGLTALNQVLRPGDGILLNDKAYRYTFMNFYKGTEPILVLPDSPGEVAVPGQPPAVTDPDGSQPDGLVAPILPMMLSRFALLTDRWWLVTEFNPSDHNRLRVTERFLTRHYYPMGEPYSANRLRIVQFSGRSAPPDIFPPWPSVRSGATFGDLFTLVGYDAPATLKVDPVRGSVLPISLLWQFNGWPTGVSPFDYSLNVSLLDHNGAVVPGAQQAGVPQGGFGLVSAWQPGGYYRDNHGLLLPPSLPAGTYHIWLLWYDYRDNSHLKVAGSDHLELTTITVP